MNLGVITDLRFVKSKNSTSASLITASGSKKRQQVNILRSGINLNAENDLEFPPIKNFWLSKGHKDPLLFVSTTLSSLSLKVNRHELKMAKFALSGYVEKLSTVNMHQIDPNLFLQITSQGAVLFHTQEMQTTCTDSTHPTFVQENGEILISAHFEKILYLFTTKNLLINFKIQKDKLENIHSILLEKQPVAVHANYDHLFVSCWNDKYIYVHDRTSLLKVHVIDTNKDGINSILTTNLGTENDLYLFIGFIDGLVRVQQYSFMRDGQNHNFETFNIKNYRFGSHPVLFQEEFFEQKKRVFALSDNGVLYYLNEQKQIAHLSLLIANVKKLCFFGEAEEANCLTLADGELTMSRLELYDKVQATNLPFESKYEVRLILPFLEESIYVAAAQDTDQATSYLKLYDSNSFKEIESFAYEDMEITSLLKFEYEDFKGILVSVAGQSAGNVDIFEFAQNTLSHKQTINYAKEALVLSKLLEKYVVVAVKSTIVVLEIEKVRNEESENFEQQPYQFKEIATKAGFSLIQHVETYNSYILLVDNIKGLHLFMFDTEEYKLVLLSVSIKNVLGSRVGCIIDENLFVLSTEGILRIFKKNIMSDADTQQRTVLIVKKFYPFITLHSNTHKSYLRTLQ